jgi:hypothetical protein
MQSLSLTGRRQEPSMQIYLTSPAIFSSSMWGVRNISDLALQEPLDRRLNIGEKIFHRFICLAFVKSFAPLKKCLTSD